MKRFKDLITESKYGDAMMSRLPSHLDDPRESKRVVPSAAYLKSKEKRKQHFANKGDIKVAESTWESYRDKALLETKNPQPLKGHPYHYKSDAELHYIIKDASEAERAIGSHDKKAMWKYGDQQNDAATVLGYRQRGGKQTPHQIGVHRPELHESKTLGFAKPKQFIPPQDSVKPLKDMGFTHSPETQLQGHRAENSFMKKGSHFFADATSHLKDQGYTATTKFTRKYGKHHNFDSPDKSHWAQVDSDKLRGATYVHFHPVTPLKEEAPHAGFVMNFSSHTEHQYHGFAKAKEDRDAYAKHLKSLGHKVKKGSTTNQLLHGSYGNVYRVSYKPDHLNEETEREAASHAVRMTPAHTADELRDQNESDDRIKQGFEAARKTNADALAKHGVTTGIKESKETYKVGDHVVPSIGPHKGQVHRVIHVHSSGHVNIKPELRPGSRNRYHLGAARAHPRDLTDAPGHGTNKLEEASVPHDVHVKFAGQWSLYGRAGSKKSASSMASKLGWATKLKKTSKDYLRQNKHLYEATTIQEESSTPGMSFNDAIVHATKHGGKVVFGSNSQKWYSISHNDRDFNMPHASEPQEAKAVGEKQAKWGVHSRTRAIINRNTVQEGFKQYLGYSKIGPDPSASWTEKRQREEIQKKGSPERNARATELKDDREKGAVNSRPYPMKRPEGMTNFGKPIKLKDYFDPFKKKKGISNESVQEAFQAAKAKKKGENPFAKKDTDKDTKPQKENPSAPAPQPQDGTPTQDPKGFGVPDGAEKKDNTPKPEKKGNKIVVQGVGPDDKFQADPIVTPLTTMPDTASPKSGSQGVR